MFRSIMTEDPVRDAARYFKEQDEAYERENASAVCECCGRHCGAEKHYRLWGDVVVCSKECALKMLDNSDINEIVDSWLEEQVEDERW